MVDRQGDGDGGGGDGERERERAANRRDGWTDETTKRERGEFSENA